MGKIRDGSKEKLLEVKRTWLIKGVHNNNKIDELKKEIARLEELNKECWRNVGMAVIELERRDRKEKDNG